MSEILKDVARTEIGHLAIKILSNEKVEIDDTCRVLGDEGDMGLYLYMALGAHVTSFGYAWAVAKDLLAREPVDERDWFRRIEIRNNGSLARVTHDYGQGSAFVIEGVGFAGEVLVGASTVRFEGGDPSRALVVAALMDWDRRRAQG